jgi:PIN domain nuclease of toxin-antitoxin system
MPTADVVVLDTHLWLDLAFGREPSIASRVLRKIERAAAGGLLYVAAITPWEVAMLARAGKNQGELPGARIHHRGFARDANGGRATRARDRGRRR